MNDITRQLYEVLVAASKASELQPIGRLGFYKKRAYIGPSAWVMHQHLPVSGFVVQTGITNRRVYSPPFNTAMEAYIFWKLTS